MQEGESIRIDKWLWAARFFKTRSLAQDAVEMGRVTSEGARVKCSHCVHFGERLVIVRGTERFEVLVAGLSAQRGSAEIARGLYAETEQSRLARLRAAQVRKMGAEPALSIRGGRPTKRDGRRLRAARFDSGDWP